jgi:hypothetical protein
MRHLNAETRTQPKNHPKGTGQTVNFSRQPTAKERIEQTNGKSVAQMTQAEKNELLELLRAALLE